MQLQTPSRIQGLGKEYFTIRNIFLADTIRIEKVIVGPTGVWVIEPIVVDGKITFRNSELLRNGSIVIPSELEQLKNKSGAVYDMLILRMRKDCTVHPVLMFKNKKADVRCGNEKIGGVYATHEKNLSSLIASFPKRYNKETLERIQKTIQDANTLPIINR